MNWLKLGNELLKYFSGRFRFWNYVWNFVFFVDHSCGYCSLLPNLLKGFGWNPGKKMNHWLGEQLKERTGDYNVTFKEVSKQQNHKD